ncbi:MAG: hypothetical protein ACW9XA_06875 [Candidatus Nitrosopumilus sp. bin_6a]
MNIYQRKIEVETSKEILLATILSNKENLDTHMIAKAIKDFVKNHEKYNMEKKECLALISKTENNNFRLEKRPK